MKYHFSGKSANLGYAGRHGKRMSRQTVPIKAMPKPKPAAPLPNQWVKSAIVSNLIKYVPDYWVNYVMFVLKQHYFPHFKQPRTLNEKVVHIKLYDAMNPLRVLVTDRLRVRDYVIKKAPGLKLARLLWHGEALTQTDWDKLPERFVLKGNHGSGMINFVDKSQDSLPQIQRLISHWMQLDYAAISREWFYAQQARFVIAEELLNPDNGVPPDYKFFCFNGKVAFVQLDIDRFIHHSRDLYDEQFSTLPVEYKFPRSARTYEKPGNFRDAVEVSEKLSHDFDFIRVDLYLLRNGIYFGELTNTPGGGFEKCRPRNFDYEMGGLLQLKSFR